MATFTSKRSPLSIVLIVLVIAALVTSILVVTSSGMRTAPGVTLITPPAQAPHTIHQPALSASVALDNTADTIVPLSDLPERHDGALIRISVVDTDSPVTVFAAGAPALTVADGAGSTTVLVPIVDGGVPLYTNHPAVIDIDVLMTFIGDPQAPGATIALSQAVTRADTSEQLAAQEFNETETAVGVVGRGGVAATEVRAVHLSVTVEPTRATTLRVGAQQMPIPAGPTTVTTVVTPAADGTVPLRLTAGTATGRVDVRGWVPEAPQNMEMQNLTGSFVPELAPEPTAVAVSAQPSPLELAAAPDIDHVLALVAAEPAESANELTINAAEPPGGAGALLNGETGLHPQLVVAPVSDAEAQLDAGSTEATVQAVGGFLAEAPEVSDAPVVTIDGPPQDPGVDLSDHGTVTLHGQLQTPGATLESVVLTVNDRIVGAPTLQYTPDGIGWHFTTAAPATGNYRFTVIATDRSGAQTQHSRQLALEVPPSDEPIIAEDVVVLSEDTEVTDVAEHRVILSEEPDVVPGEIIVSDVTANAPEGFLRRVQAVDQRADQWVVTTDVAALTEAIVQANVSEELDLLDVDEDLITEHTQPLPGDTQDLTVFDDGQPAVTLLSGSEVDVAPYDHQFTEDQDSAATAHPKVGPVAARTSNVETGAILEHSLELQAAYAWETAASQATEYAKAQDEAKAEMQHQIAANGGVSVAGSAQVSIGLAVNLDVSPVWNWGLPEVIVDDFSVIATTDAKAQGEALMSLGAQATAEYALTADRTLASVDLPTFRLQVLAMPIVVTSDLEFKLTAGVTGEIRAEGKVDFTLDTKLQRTHDYGFRYSTADGVVDVDEYRSSFEPPELSREVSAELAGKVDARIGPEVLINISLYDAAGPEMLVGVYPGAELSLEGTADQQHIALEASAAVFIDTHLSGNLVLKVPIIDKVLVEAPLFTHSARLPLESWDWAWEHLLSDDVGVVEVSAGRMHTLARTADGQVYAWGDNSHGQLGQGDTTDRVLEPVLVPGLPEIRSITAGEDRSFAVTTDGDVYHWGGDNQLVEWGESGVEVQTTPVLFSGLTDITSVAYNAGTLLAINSVGEVYGWGFNGLAAAGSGDWRTDMSVARLDTPTKIEGLTDITHVSTGPFSAARRDDGTVFAWGNNTHGDIGIAIDEDQQWGDLITTPVEVPDLPNISTTSVHSAASLGVGADGRVYDWGIKSRENYGNATSQPAVVPGLAEVARLSASGADIFGTASYSALTTDGLVYTWGNNDYGQLGTGDTVTVTTPVQIPGLADVGDISSGYTHAVAVTNSGEVYTWGTQQPAEWGATEPSPAQQLTPELLEFPPEAADQ